MRKKNQLPVKWMLVVMVILVVVVTHQASRDIAAPGSSIASSQSNFFTFLANIFGWGHASSLSGENNASNSGLGLTGGINAGNKQNPNSLLTPNGSAPQGTISAQKGNAAGNNPSENSAANAENNPGNLSEMDTKSTSELNAENNQGYNAEFNAESNAEFNAETNSEINAENNQGYNAETNPENNAGYNAEAISENSAGSNSGGDAGTGSGEGQGSSASTTSGGASDNNPGFPNPSGLPTINPIPSDNTVSESIARQNQQNDALAALLASRQALVAPVQQQAQSSKYQTVNSQNIPAVSTNPAPSDIVEKVRSNQLSLH